MFKLEITSFLIRKNNRFFLGWLRQLNLFSTTQDTKEVEYILEMLYRNKIYDMPIDNQIRIYEKLSFIHHSIPKNVLHSAMKKICNNVGKDKYKKVISAIENNRLPSQKGFLSDILFSFIMFDKVKGQVNLQVV